jgi:hypothetical protein
MTLAVRDRVNKFARSKEALQLFFTATARVVDQFLLDLI